MRNGTFIIPSTGERSRRQFTLRTSSSSSANSNASQRATGTDDDDADQLLSPETAGERLQLLKRQVGGKFVAVWNWLNSDQGHAVIKCTLAYLLGSMGTFWNPLSKFLGQRDGKHIVATLTVYFHPARTAGSMLEAIFLAICAVLYAEVINLLSMGIVIFGRTYLDIVMPAHVLVLVVCVGGGLGFIGWVKQRLNQPLVNVSSTLASIAIISIITKEEAIQGGYFSGTKIIQVLKMLVLGVSFTTAVNLLIWPKSARLILRQEMVKATMALSDKVSFIARGFLNGDEDDVDSEDYGRIRLRYNSAYAKMTATLREAKNEHYVLGREKIYQLDKKLYKSIETLSQAISGLRSAMDAEFTLRRETPLSDNQSGYFGPQSPKIFRTASASGRDRLSVIDESHEENEQGSWRRDPMQQSDPSLNRTPAFRYPADIFTYFMDLLGPSMKSLSYTLSEILKDSPFGKNPQKQVIVNDQLRESLKAALSLYNEARGNALQDLYLNIQLGRTHSEAIQADIEEVAAACGHFSFSLQAVAEEMDQYLEVLEDMKHTTTYVKRSWEWLKFWKRFGLPRSQKKRLPVVDDPEQEDLIPKQQQPVPRLRRSADPKGIPDQMVVRRDTFNWDAAPQASKIKRKISELVLRLMRFIAREDITFGVKVGIGAILWAQFAFIPSTRPIYSVWRGEWGLLSYMIVVAMTTGASNTTSLARFIGTLIGGACSILAWLIGQESPFVLALIGCIMAFANFYLILVLNNAPLGRISLLAYNVITLYAYSISQQVCDDDDDEGGESPLIFDITFHRVVSVTLGIAWGMIVCRLLWPISARRKFREGLSVLYLQLGLIWKRGPLGILLQTRITTDYMREGEQVALQRYGESSPPSPPPLSRVLLANLPKPSNWKVCVSQPSPNSSCAGPSPRRPTAASCSRPRTSSTASTPCASSARSVPSCPRASAPSSSSRPTSASSSASASATSSRSSPRASCSSTRSPTPSPASTRTRTASWGASTSSARTTPRAGWRGVTMGVPRWPTRRTMRCCTRTRSSRARSRPRWTRSRPRLRTCSGYCMRSRCCSSRDRGSSFMIYSMHMVARALGGRNGTCTYGVPTRAG